MVIINDFPLNAEYWRAVDKFPKYEVSTDGRIRIAKTGKIMKAQIDRNGYVRTGLTKDGVSTSVSVHITVATAFRDKEEQHTQVDHIDHNRANNNYLNLRWVTRSINNRNALIRKDNKTGLQGVYYRSDHNGHWVATWADEYCSSKSKRFSVNKYGAEQAKKMAIDFRHKMALENNYLNV